MLKSKGIRLARRDFDIWRKNMDWDVDVLYSEKLNKIVLKHLVILSDGTFPVEWNIFDAQEVESLYGTSVDLYDHGKPWKTIGEL